MTTNLAEVQGTLIDRGLCSVYYLLPVRFPESDRRPVLCLEPVGVPHSHPPVPLTIGAAPKRRWTLRWRQMW